MSLRTPRTDLHPASISRTFLAAGLGSAVVLADQLEATFATSPAGAPAAGINHMPSTLFVNAASGQILEWTDVLGNINTVTFAAAFVGTLPFTARSIGGATTNVTSVTVSWTPEA